MGNSRSGLARPKCFDAGIKLQKVSKCAKSISCLPVKELTCRESSSNSQGQDSALLHFFFCADQTPTTRECQPNSFLDEPSIPCTHPERIRLRGPFCPIAQLPNCHDVVRDSQETVMFTCRAHRHHRKRLARIVADQWLYVARYVSFLQSCSTHSIPLLESDFPKFKECPSRPSPNKIKIKI